LKSQTAKNTLKKEKKEYIKFDDLISEEEENSNSKNQDLQEDRYSILEEMASRLETELREENIIKNFPKSPYKNEALNESNILDKSKTFAYAFTEGDQAKTPEKDGKMSNSQFLDFELQNLEEKKRESRLRRSKSIEKKVGREDDEDLVGFGDSVQHKNPYRNDGEFPDFKFEIFKE
jgi:hypothetical protein